MRGGSIRGVVGKVVWAYHVAAAINGYTVTRTQGGLWSMTGLVVLADAFKMAQKDLWFVAPHAKGAWRWPMRERNLANGTLTATLGPPDGERE